MRGLISKSRYLIIIPVIGSFIAATILLIYGGIEIFLLIGEAFTTLFVAGLWGCRDVGDVGMRGCRVLSSTPHSSLPRSPGHPITLSSSPLIFQQDGQDV